MNINLPKLTSLALSMLACNGLLAASPVKPLGNIEPITGDVGGLGAEIVSKVATNLRAAKGSQNYVNTDVVNVIYANIDNIESSKSKNTLMPTLYAAAKLRKPILLESDFWDSRKLEAIATNLFGKNLVTEADSAILLAEWSGSEWNISRNLSVIHSKMGVDYDKAPELPEAKALDGTVTMDWTLNYVDATYNTSNWDVGTSTQIYRPEDQTYAVWRNNNDGLCTLAWRGSVTDEDWVQNVYNQMANIYLYDIPFDTFGVPVAGGAYYFRFSNKSAAVQSAFRTGNCKTIVVTGHSLGGAMSLFTAWAWSYVLPDTFSKLRRVTAYNPARVGNNSFVSNFNSRMTGKTVQAYCRNGDPVKLVPVGFAEQCTYTGAQYYSSTVLSGPAILINPAAPNHSRMLWSKCRSKLSC